MQRSALPEFASQGGWRPATSRRSFRSRFVRGITLVELMVVVIIAGALGVVALRAMREHLNASRSIEALSMIQSIRSAEERYRATHMAYLDVSTSGDSGWYPRDPRPNGAANGDRRVPFLRTQAGATHGDNLRWLTLSPTVSAPVQFGYKVNAGLPGQAMTPSSESVTGLVWPAPVEPWYVVQAIADSDQDGRSAFFIASSIGSVVYSAGEGE